MDEQTPEQSTENSPAELTLDSYRYQPPEGVQPDPKVIDTVKQAALEAKLSPEQFQAVTDAFNRAAAERAAEISKGLDRDPKQAIEELRKEWGAATDQRLTELQSLTEAAFPEEVHDLLEASGLATDPRYVKAIWALIEKAKGPAPTLPQNSTGPSPEQAREKLTAFMKDPENQKALLDQNHPRHKEVVLQRARLYEVAYGGSVGVQLAEPQVRVMALTGTERPPI